MPPAFVLSQNQTLQTKLLNHFKWLFCSRIISCLLNSILIQFIYYDFKIFRSQNLTGSSHYSIFKDHYLNLAIQAFYLSLIALHWEAQRSHNLASFFRLSNHFLKIFQTFFHRTLGTDHRFQRHEVKYSTKFSFVKSFFEDFSNFSQSIVFSFIHQNQAKTWDAI